ncbi:hypothetical protein GCM10010392_14940 [Streptomyces clavifer]|nr:hypothetical protein GCM10010392_14940 [Streptomyces clavifer]
MQESAGRPQGSRRRVTSRLRVRVPGGALAGGSLTDPRARSAGGPPAPRFAGGPRRTERVQTSAKGSSMNGVPWWK